MRKRLSGLRIGHLLNHPASHAATTTAQRRRVIGVVVAADVDHQGLALDVRHFQARGQDRVGGNTHGVDGQRRQVAQMAIAPWGAVLAGLCRVEVATRGTSRDGLTVGLVRRAAAVGVDVEAVQARGQVLKVGREHDAVLGFAELHGAHGGAIAFVGGQLEGHGIVGSTGGSAYGAQQDGTHPSHFHCLLLRGSTGIVKSQPSVEQSHALGRPADLGIISGRGSV